MHVVLSWSDSDGRPGAPIAGPVVIPAYGTAIVRAEQAGRAAQGAAAAH